MLDMRYALEKDWDRIMIRRFDGFHRGPREIWFNCSSAEHVRWQSSMHNLYRIYHGPSCTSDPIALSSSDDTTWSTVVSHFHCTLISYPDPCFRLAGTVEWIGSRP